MGKKQRIEITINALTINLFSSAKTLLEDIRKAADGTDNSSYWTKNYSEVCKEMSEIISEKYDRNFNNRLSQQLRNFSQHGYLPVDFRCRTGESTLVAAINFGKLLCPKFNFNKKVQKEIEEISDLITSMGKQANYSYIELILSYCEDVNVIKLSRSGRQVC